MAGKFRQEYAFLRRGIAAAHHKNLLTGKEFSVTGGAVSNTPSFVFFLTFESDRSRVCAGCQQNTKAPVIPLAGMHGFDISRKVKAGGFCEYKFRTEALRLLLNSIRQRLAAGFGNAGIVDHLMGNGDLPAKLLLLQNQHPILRAGKVKCGGQPRRATADDHYIVQIVHQS